MNSAAEKIPSTNSVQLFDCLSMLDEIVMEHICIIDLMDESDWAKNVDVSETNERIV